MAPSEAQKRAAATHERKLQGKGWRKVTFRASPEMAADLDALIATHGTLQAAIKAALAAARP